MNFRGRSYKAYFTNDIPITIGPWKFNGLPGLIVYIEDEQGIYTWELTSIKENVDFHNKVHKFSEFKKKNENLSYQSYDKVQIEALIEKLKVLKARSGQRKYKTVRSISTEQWLEPSNEFRSQTNFSM